MASQTKDGNNCAIVSVPKDDDHRSLNPFLGVLSWKCKYTLKWLTNEEYLEKAFAKILACNSARKTVKHLPPVKVCPSSTVSNVLVTHIVSPSEIYVIFDRKIGYILDHPEWTKFFPPMTKGTEAIYVLNNLMGLFYTSTIAEGGKWRKDFTVGDLVAVKYLGNEAAKSRTKYYQIRRGLVTGIKGSSSNWKHPIYLVYLLDFGFTVSLSGNLLFPLVGPFDKISPLVIKCGLFGISPIAPEWNNPAKKHFRDLLLHSRHFALCADVMSREDFVIIPPHNNLLLINLEARSSSRVPQKTTNLRFLQNFSGKMIESEHAIAWNLFPLRPKIMSPGSFDSAKAALALRKGLMLSPLHPTVLQPLPNHVIHQEITKLFLLRNQHFNFVYGMDNRVVLKISGKNSKACTKPCILLQTLNLPRKTEDDAKKVNMSAKKQLFDLDEIPVLRKGAGLSRGRGRGRGVIRAISED